jgi:hypothetical protein
VPYLINRRAAGYSYEGGLLRQCPPLWLATSRTEGDANSRVTVLIWEGAKENSESRTSDHPEVAV